MRDALTGRRDVVGDERVHVGRLQRVQLGPRARAHHGAQLVAHVLRRAARARAAAAVTRTYKKHSYHTATFRICRIRST